MSDAFLRQILQHFFNGIFFICQSVQETGIDHLAVAGIGFFLNVPAFDDLNNFHTEFFRELVITLIVSRHSHNRSRSVAHHDIICDKQRNFLSGNRVYRCQSLNLYSGFVLCKLRPLKLCLFRAPQTVGFHITPVFDTVPVLIQQRVLRGNEHKSDTIKCVTARGVDLQFFISPVQREVYKRTRGFSDPGDFLLLDAFRIIHMVQPLQQLIRILGDPEEPHILGQLNYIAVADVALSSLGIFIGKNNLAVRAVINQCFRPEYQTMLEQFFKNPLCPVIVILSGCRKLSVPVEGKSDAFQLLCKMPDIFLCDVVRMRIGLDGIIFRRQSEGVKTNRKQHVISLHSPLSGEDFNAGIRLDMSDMHSRT